MFIAWKKSLEKANGVFPAKGRTAEGPRAAALRRKHGGGELLATRRLPGGSPTQPGSGSTGISTSRFGKGLSLGAGAAGAQPGQKGLRLTLLAWIKTSFTHTKANPYVEFAAGQTLTCLSTCHIIPVSEKKLNKINNIIIMCEACR